MSTEKINRLWLLATGLLILIIIVSSILIWKHQDKSQIIPIYPPQSSSFSGEVYVYGAVAQPKVYSVKDGESISGLVHASGGTTGNADLKHMHLFIPNTNENQEPQKINLNRAESWLLQALPGIGEARAQAIIDYRQKIGAFHSTEEIKEVPGVSLSMFEKIKNLVTVTD